eukprot:1233919-Rhodomonas_salina.2
MHDKHGPRVEVLALPVRRKLSCAHQLGMTPRIRRPTESRALRCPLRSLSAAPPNDPHSSASAECCFSAVQMVSEPMSIMMVRREMLVINVMNVMLCPAGPSRACRVQKQSPDGLFLMGSRGPGDAPSKPRVVRHIPDLIVREPSCSHLTSTQTSPQITQHQIVPDRQNSLHEQDRCAPSEHVDHVGSKQHGQKVGTTSTAKEILRLRHLISSIGDFLGVLAAAHQVELCRDSVEVLLVREALQAVRAQVPPSPADQHKEDQHGQDLFNATTHALSAGGSDDLRQVRGKLQLASEAGCGADQRDDDPSRDAVDDGREEPGVDREYGDLVRGRVQGEEQGVAVGGLEAEHAVGRKDAVFGQGLRESKLPEEACELEDSPDEEQGQDLESLDEELLERDQALCEEFRGLQQNHNRTSHHHGSTCHQKTWALSGKHAVDSNLAHEGRAEGWVELHFDAGPLGSEQEAREDLSRQEGASEGVGRKCTAETCSEVLRVSSSTESKDEGPAMSRREHWMRGAHVDEPDGNDEVSDFRNPHELAKGALGRARPVEHEREPGHSRHVLAFGVKQLVQLVLILVLDVRADAHRRRRVRAFVRAHARRLGVLERRHRDLPGLGRERPELPPSQDPNMHSGTTVSTRAPTLPTWTL